MSNVKLKIMWPGNGRFVKNEKKKEKKRKKKNITKKNQYSYLAI